jgi:hypothetical protein
MRRAAVVLCLLAAGCLTYDPSPGTPPHDEPLEIAQIPGFTQADQARLQAEFMRLHPWESRDANKDGCFDASEFADRGWTRFMLFDLDRSGTISRAEFLSAIFPIRENPSGPELQNRRRDSWLFSRSDRNSDGELTRDEAEERPREIPHSVLSRNFYADRCLR